MKNYFTPALIYASMGNGEWAKHEKAAFIDHYSPLTVQK